MNDESSVRLLQILGLGGVTTVAIFMGYGLMMLTEMFWRWWERRG